MCFCVQEWELGIVKIVISDFSAFPDVTFFLCNCSYKSHKHTQTNRKQKTSLNIIKQE